MADININDLTSGYIDGSGVFDTLMTSIQSRLEEQYESGRIKGSEYATVYLGAMQYAMTEAVKFLLGEQQADKQAELLQAQIDEIIADSARKDALNTAQINLIVEQIAASQAKTTRENNLANAQISKLASDEDVNIAQISLFEAQSGEIPLESVRRDNLNTAEIALKEEQVDKTTAEKSLLEQKKVSEEMQTVGNGAANTGLIGAQIRLYDKQKDGFDRDAKQKATKTILDAWSVAMTADPTSVVIPTSFTPGTGALEKILADLVADVGGSMI